MHETITNSDPSSWDHPDDKGDCPGEFSLDFNLGRNAQERSARGPVLWGKVAADNRDPPSET